MQKKKLLFQILLSAACCLVSLSVYSGINSEKEKRSKAGQYMANQPVYFLENKGQMSDEKGDPLPFVLFKLNAPGLNAFVTEKGLSYVFFKSEEKFEEEENKETGRKEVFNIERAWINLNLPGANIKGENVLKEQEVSEHFNYFYPHCPDGVYGVKGYRKLVIKNIYSGIDWVLYGSSQSGMKYDFIVHPGADINQIKLIYESANPLTIDENGSIEIHTALGTLTEQSPVCYLHETNQPVPSSFSKKIIDRNNVEITYKVPAFPGNSTLVIDPQQVWGTLFSGTSDQGGATSMEVDNNNNLFIVGYTNGLGTGFPLMNAGTYYNNTITSVYDLFILKFSNTGALLWGTYYGGNGNERALYEFPFITTDAAGNIFVTGQTTSTDFPVQNAGTYFDSTFTGSGQFNSYIIKFDNLGNRLWATYFGESGISFPGGTVIISSAVDPSGSLFITGYTNSTSGFPLQPYGTAYYDNSHNGVDDIFISKFDNAGNLLWSTYYGGSSREYAYGIVSDTSGNIFLTGYTMSSNFPTQNAGTYFDGIFGFNEDAFMVKFDNLGNLLWSTYFGGTTVGGERAISIGCDANQNIFVYGYTSSADFPTMNAGTYFDGIVNGEDMFISKFDNAGNLLWSTYFGGNTNPISAWDFWEADGLTIDDCGNVYIAYDNNAGDDPLYNPGCNSYIDSTAYLMLVEFSNAGDLLWSTRIGAGAGGGALRFVIEADHNNALYFAHEYNAPSTSAGVPFVFLPGAYNNTTFGPAITTNHDDFLLKFIPTPVSATIASVDDSCGCTGTATVNPTCGTPPYNYLWSNAQTTQTASGLCAGTYSVIITDNSCAGTPDTAFVTITSLSSITATVDSSSTSCTANTGTATVTPSNGTPPYTYLWTPSGQTTATATGLSAGTYTVLVTDSTGCSQVFSVTVPEPDIPVASVLSQTNVLCNGGNDGAATVNVSGGASPYYYSWSPTGGTSATATGLFAGTYTVLITDSNGCTDIDTVVISQPPPLTVTGSSTQANCSSATGSASVTPSGGTPGYTFSWNNGQTTQTATGLVAGTYTVTVTDSNGCTQIQTVTVTSVNTLTLSVSSTQAGCIQDNGTATANPSGGNAPYSYLWSDGQTTQTASGLAAGTYTVVVIDSDSCMQSAVVTITAPSSGPIAYAGTDVTISFGSSTSLTSTGGGTYLWNTGDTTASITVSPTTDTEYCVVVTDSNQCTDTACVKVFVIIEIPCPTNNTLTVPNAFSPNNDGQNDVFCLAGWNVCIQNFIIHIYDRWGEEVFQSGNPDFCWEGTYKGKPMDAAVFVYFIEAKLTTSEEIVRKGNISLIR